MQSDIQQLIIDFFPCSEGEYEVWKGGKYLYTMGPGNCFGELALLYNCKRTASIKGKCVFLLLSHSYRNWVNTCFIIICFCLAVRAARIWVLERSIFQYIMMKTGMEKMQERVKFLSR